MDAHIRVIGHEGASYMSPDTQREAIARSAEYRGVEILAWHVDDGQQLPLLCKRLQSGEVTH